MTEFMVLTQRLHVEELGKSPHPKEKLRIVYVQCRDSN
jgi:hypothetical protein